MTWNISFKFPLLPRRRLDGRFWCGRFRARPIFHRFVLDGLETWFI